MIATIDRLVHHEGYTLRGARIALEGHKVAAAPAPADIAQLAHGGDAAPSAANQGVPVARLAAIRADLARALQET